MTEQLVNKEIKFKQVRVIAESGEQLGVMPTFQALKHADEAGLDLVCVSPNSSIPVCKIMDFGKFKFESQKKAKEAKKNQFVIKNAEVQITYTIQEHDLLTKAKTIKRLIEDKNSRVKIVLRLRGRETSYMGLAIEKVNHLVELCSDFAKLSKPLFVEGRDIKCVIEKK